MADNTAKISVPNHDIWWLASHLYDMMYEVEHSQSSNLNYYKNADIMRLQGYIKEYRSKLVVVQGRPEMDNPESHPNLKFDLDPIPSPALVDNAASNLIMALIKISAYELVNSDSARDSAKLNVHDYNRQEALMQKIEAIIADYILVSTPQDWPEVSPRTPSVQSGRLGI